MIGKSGLPRAPPTSPNKRKPQPNPLLKRSLLTKLHVAQRGDRFGSSPRGPPGGFSLSPDCPPRLGSRTEPGETRTVHPKGIPTRRQNHRQTLFSSPTSNLRRSQLLLVPAPRPTPALSSESQTGGWCEEVLSYHLRTRVRVYTLTEG